VSSDSKFQPQILAPAPIPLLDPSWKSVRSFLSVLNESILCYIPDAEEIKSTGKYPVFHSDTLDLEKQNQGYGIFYSVNGFSNLHSRKQNNLTSLNAVFADVDFPKQIFGKPNEQQLKNFKRDVLEHFAACALDGFAPTFIIETKNGLHALWVFDTPLLLNQTIDSDNPESNNQEPQNASEISSILSRYSNTLNRIINHFHADPGVKDVCRVLRLPNTWHLKDPKSPFLVKILPQQENNLYEFEALEEYFKTLAEDASTQPLEKLTKQLSPIHSEEIIDLAWKKAGGKQSIPPDVFAELNARYPKIERPSIQTLLNKDNIAEGSRNHSLLIAASAMRESGKTEADTLAYFDHYNGLGEYEILHTIKSAYKSPQPLSFGWNHPIIAPLVTHLERTHISHVLSTILREREINPPEQKEKIAKQKKEAKENLTLEKSFLQKLYAKYEFVVVERHPNLKYQPQDGCFYRYDRGVYKQLSTEDMRSLFANEMLQDGLTDYRSRHSIEDKIMCLKSIKEIHLQANSEPDEVSYVNVLNGLLDFNTGKLHPHTPNHFSTNQLPIFFHPGDVVQKAPRWIQFVHEIMLNDVEKVRFLKQMAGYCFTKSVKYQKAFILYGTGANGKSTFIDTIMSVMGEDCVSSLNLKALHERFGVAKLAGKTMNVIEEIGNNFFESDQIKKIITGAEITADRKFTEPLVFRPHAKFVFAVNTLPRINDTSTGLYRRFYVVDFLASFENTAQTDLSEQLKAEREGILLWCMEGWQDLVASGGFVVPESISNAGEHFKESNSPLIEFILRNFEILPPSRLTSFPILSLTFFDMYQREMRNLGFQPKNYANIMKELQNMNHKILGDVVVSPHKTGKVIYGIKPYNATSLSTQLPPNL